MPSTQGIAGQVATSGKSELYCFEGSRTFSGFINPENMCIPSKQYSKHAPA